MATKLLLIASVFLSSCAASRSQNSLVGDYHARGKDYSYSLTLDADSTFKLAIWVIEVKSSCEGDWQMIGKDTIFLQCRPPQFPEQLEGGYMSDRERKVAVINRRMLKIDNVQLKRGADN